MRKSTFLAFVLVLMLALTSCGKNEMDMNTPTTTTTGTTPQASEYYFSYKANGVAVTETEVTALRGSTASPRTLTITGSGKAGTGPKLKYYAAESVVGFVPGLTTESSSGSTGYHEIEYTNSDGLVHKTTLAKEKMTMFFTELSYTSGGVVKATFEGTIKAANGSTVLITEGKFRVKISN